MAAAVNLKTHLNLHNERLIHLEEPIRDRPTWKQWFEQQGVPNCEPTAGLRLNDYALVLQGAIASEGLAFGWKHLTQSLLSQGLLAARKDWSWETGLGFYLVWSRFKPLTTQARQVRDRILTLSGN